MKPTSPSQPTKSIERKVYVRNWTCKKHNTFGDDPFIPCAKCGYSGRGRVKVFESFDEYKNSLGISK